MFVKKIDGFEFRAPSKVKGKKYDVYKDGKKVVSFGAINYQHYHDKIGYYSDKNHNDTKRRDNYRSRHMKDKLQDKTSAGYFAWHYLW